MAATISICIPSYNCEKYVRTTIESVLMQTIPAHELLISDDRSPDRSYEIVREYEGVAGVKVMRPPHRMTLGEHYRFLAEQATGDYLCFLACDDALMPNFIESMLRVVGVEDHLAMVSAACVDTDSALRPQRISGMGSPRGALDPPEGFLYFKTGCIYKISFAVLSRRLLLEIPAIPKEGDLATDWCWALLLGTKGTMRFVREPLGWYRIHGNNAGHDAGLRWQKACKVMLPFVQQQLDPGLAQHLDAWLKIIDQQVAEHRNASEPPSMPFLVRLKNAAKSTLALRYARLPGRLRMAEKGMRAVVK